MAAILNKYHFSVFSVTNWP